MAYLEDLTTPATGDAAMRRLKTRLVAAGWSVIASGDGRSAYGASSDVITDVITADSGAGSLDASGAWMRLRPGSGTRELLIIRGGASTTWTVRYSAAGFSGGSPPSATTAPTAADQQNLISAAQLLPADGGYRWLVCAEDAAPYHVWAAAMPMEGGAARTLIGLWPMRSGSYPSADTEPYVAIAAYDAGGVATASRMSGYNTCPSGFVSGTWRLTPFARVDAFHSVISAIGPASSGEDLPAEILCVAVNWGPAYFGPRGYVRDARWVLTNTTTSPHGTHLEQGSRYWVRIGDLWLPWGSTPPAL